MEYRSHFVFKNAICFLPRKQDLRLTGKIWNTRLRLNQAHKMHLKLGWSSADPGLRKSKSSKMSSVFL
jgi:hypothetical protein